MSVRVSDFSPAPKNLLLLQSSAPVSAIAKKKKKKKKKKVLGIIMIISLESGIPYVIWDKDNLVDVYNGRI
ncbi:hypothetical protein L484_004325 [Morus notabilis]|uniref:Uncharacterized protein n=1 Tax=Morus notabilis TaxID=981085 RepID=W9RJ91_9ROSA|nr:hypothetical protein L484_004325 [Morus notabilis]